MALPRFLQPHLPSYDIFKMDVKNPADKEEIITAILNYGNSKTLKWLFKTYSLEEIKEEIKNPSRGCWDRKALNYWTKIFDVKVDKDIYEMAIFSLEPRFEKWDRWFKILEKRRKNARTNLKRNID